MSGTAALLALRPPSAPEHFPRLSLQVGRPYLHVAAGAIFNKLQRSPRACPTEKEKKQMNRIFGAAAFALALGFAVPVMAASEADCKTRWDKADVSKSGTLEGKAATAYLDAITKSGKKYDLKAVDKLSATEFMAACKNDAFKTI